MKNSKVANFVIALVLLTLGVSSCDILFDPYDPGNGGGKDTVIWEDPCDSTIWDDPRDTVIWDDPTDTVIVDDGDNDFQMVRSQGTVLWVPIEGGFWGIEAANGHDYEVLNLPREFQQHGIKVDFAGNVYPDGVSMYMWGEVLEITSIQRVR
jgi:hypothetical protein